MKELQTYRARRGISQAQLAEALGVTQAYVSQLESGHRPVSRQLAQRLASLPELPHLSPTVFPAHLQAEDADANLAADLGALGYPAFSPSADRSPRNPAAVILAIIGQAHVGPNVMAAVPWILLTFAALDRSWLLDEVRRKNLQNRLGFLTDLALTIARTRVIKGEVDAAQIGALESLRDALEDSRLVKADTLARTLTAAERQFFEEHRSEIARHWNLFTGLAVDHLPYR